MSLLHPKQGTAGRLNTFSPRLPPSLPGSCSISPSGTHVFPPSAKPKARVQLRSPRVGQLKAKEGVLALRETQQQNSPHKAGLPLET